MTRNKGATIFWGMYLGIASVLFFLSCSAATEPSVGITAEVVRVENIDSTHATVTFEATTVGPLWWTVTWVDIDYRLDYGHDEDRATATVRYNPHLRFWLEFKAWNTMDTAVATYMHTPEDPQ